MTWDHTIRLSSNKYEIIHRGHNYFKFIHQTIVFNRKTTILAESKVDKVSNMDGATMWMHRSLELGQSNAWASIGTVQLCFKSKNPRQMYIFYFNVTFVCRGW